ncbi:hypothetical protein Dimus_024450 [Dionaea muscipula]
MEDISDKVDMDLAEEVVQALEDKEAADKKDSSAKHQAYRRRKRARKSSRKLIVSASDKEEEVDVEATTLMDDAVLTTYRDMDEDTTGMEIVMYQGPLPTSTPKSTSNHGATHGASSSFVDMTAHIEQAVKCLLSAIEEQSLVMKALLKHLEFHGS